MSKEKLVELFKDLEKENIDKISIDELINFFEICRLPDLSHDFIVKYKDFLNWNDISYYVNLKKETIVECKDFIVWEELVCNYHVTETEHPDLYVSLLPEFSEEIYFGREDITFRWEGEDRDLIIKEVIQFVKKRYGVNIDYRPGYSMILKIEDGFSVYEFTDNKLKNVGVWKFN